MFYEKCTRVQICIQVRICSTFPGVQIALIITYVQFNLDKLPIFSIRPCMKESYINRPFIKLKIMASVATASSDMQGCQVEQMKFLAHGLRFARFYFRTMSLIHLSNRNQSLPEPWRRARVQAIRVTPRRKGTPCMITENHPLRVM